MGSFNQLILMGNITRDIELSYTAGQVAIAKFGVACNKKIKGVDKTMFIDCTAFRDCAENINKFFHKGSNIFLIGEINLDQWEDKDGSKRSKHTMNVRAFTFTEKSDSTGNNSKPVDNTPVDDDDIPF